MVNSGFKFLVEKGRSILSSTMCFLLLLFMSGRVWASEIDIELPSLEMAKCTMLNGLDGNHIFAFGLLVALIGIGFGLFQYMQVKNLPVHKAMADVSNLIWETCKTYLFRQGKFLVSLWVIIAICMAFYFACLAHQTIGTTMFILFWSLVGMAGSYGVAWF